MTPKQFVETIGRLNRPYSKFIRGLFHRLRVGECRANNNGRIKFCDGAEQPQGRLCAICAAQAQEYFVTTFRQRQRQVRITYIERQVIKSGQQTAAPLATGPRVENGRNDHDVRSQGFSRLICNPNSYFSQTFEKLFEIRVEGSSEAPNGN